MLFLYFYREEWEWIQTINADQHVAPPTNTQQQFRNQITEATNKLLGMLGKSQVFGKYMSFFVFDAV